MCFHGKMMKIYYFLKKKINKLVKSILYKNFLPMWLSDKATNSYPTKNTWVTLVGKENGPKGIFTKPCWPIPSCCNKILINKKYLSLTHGSMANRLLNMIITSKFDETGTVCSIWTKCDCVKIFDINVCFDTMALLAWWSATEAKLITEQFDIDSWIIEVSTFYRRKKLRSLEYLLELDPFD